MALETTVKLTKEEFFQFFLDNYKDIFNDMKKVMTKLINDEKRYVEGYRITESIDENDEKSYDITLRFIQNK